MLRDDQMSTRTDHSALAKPVLGLSTQVTIWLVLAVALVWFVTPSLRHLVPSDEGRYAEIAREMFASGGREEPGGEDALAAGDEGLAPSGAGATRLMERSNSDLERNRTNHSAIVFFPES
jgi:hypothetical protein